MELDDQLKPTRTGLLGRCASRYRRFFDERDYARRARWTKCMRNAVKAGYSEQELSTLRESLDKTNAVFRYVKRDLQHDDPEAMRELSSVLPANEGAALCAFMDNDYRVGKSVDLVDLMDAGRTLLALKAARERERAGGWHPYDSYVVRERTRAPRAGHTRARSGRRPIARRGSSTTTATRGSPDDRPPRGTDDDEHEQARRLGWWR